MSIERFFIIEATVQRAGTTTSRYGDEDLDWSAPTETIVHGWRNQASAEEPVGPGRALVTVVHDQFFLPADTDVTEHDRIVIDGVTHEVDGQPRKAYTPGAGVHHLELNLQAVTG